MEDNVWFQLGFYNINWQGNGSFLSAVYHNRDRRHGGQLYYRVARIGGGFRLIYKKIYGTVLRADYGVNIENSNQRGVVIGFGQYF